MDSINEVFGAATHRWRKNPDFKAGLAALAWESVLGPEVAAHVQLVRLDSGVAWVKASSPVWAHQLVYLKADILSRLAEKLGPKLVNDIRLARGMASIKAPRQAPEPVPEPLTALQEVQVRQCAAQIHDPGLQQAMERAMGAMLQRQTHLIKQGWLSCLECGSLTDEPKRVCLLCRLRQAEARHATLVAALKATPWATVWDIRITVPDVEPREFGKLRVLLLKNSWAEAQSFLARNKRAEVLPEYVQEALKLHLMLRTLRPWNRIDAATVEHYAGKNIRVLMVRSGAVSEGPTHPPNRRTFAPRPPAGEDERPAPARPSSRTP